MDNNWRVVEDQYSKDREYRIKRDTCPQCKSPDKGEVRNYDPMWHDGEVWCKDCNVKIRNWDAG